MPENDKDQHGSPHEFAVVVNAEGHEVRDANVTFNEVVELAFPGGSTNPDYIFRVDFENAASQPHSGTLVEGGHTEVKRSGTEFSVIRSVRS
jgi:hypothetical protein